MSTISLDRSVLAATPKAISSEPVKWTDAKVKRAWLIAAAAILATLAVASTALTFSVSLWFLAAAIPFFLSTGATLWYASKVVDYDSPQELTKIKTQIQDWPLSKIIEKHGLDKLFQYKLLSPETFERAYHFHMQPMQFMDRLAFYTECQRYTSSYSLPEPKLWKEKLLEETKGLRFDLLMNYPLAKLIRLSVIEPAELDCSFRNYAETLSLNQVIKTYESTTALIHDANVPGYALTEPSAWKAKFRQETAHLNCSEIVSDYRPMRPDLVHYQIIAPEEGQLLQKAEESFHRFHALEDQCKVEFDQKTTQERNLREGSKRLANQTFEANHSHAMLSQLRHQYDRDIESAWHTADIETMAARSRIPYHEHEIVGLRSLESSNRNGRYIALCADIRHRYDLDRASLESNLRTAENLRNQAIDLAYQQFELSTKPVREEIDRKIAGYRAERDRSLDAINQEYAQFRQRVAAQ